jgi:hypothetical protein
LAKFGSHDLNAILIWCDNCLPHLPTTIGGQAVALVCPQIFFLFLGGAGPLTVSRATVDNATRRPRTAD